MISFNIIFFSSVTTFPSFFLFSFNRGLDYFFTFEILNQFCNKKRMCMKKFLSMLFIASLTLFVMPADLLSQISQGGTAPSFHLSGLNKAVEVRDIQAPDMEQIIMEDMERDGMGKAYRIGVLLPVNLNPSNSGTWETLANGDLLWRLQIDMNGAEASNLYFDRFVLPQGGKLFVYSPSKTFTIGAFTEFNNHESGLMSTELIPGESQVVELYLPADQASNYELNISETGYHYRSTGYNVQNEKDLSCMVNAKCPPADSWQSQVSGSAKVLIRIGTSSFLCSGSLVNNTLNNCDPYFLLADHCTYYNSYATAANLNQWVFYFNYQASTCAGTTGTTTQTSVGCALKAHDTYGQSSSGSDFYLVLINNAVPSTYQVYYNGWNKSGTAATSGAGIHHPEGVIKKFSVYSTSLSNYSTHWRVIWANQVGYGHSVTAQGSSGSPIFDQNKLIVGTLTGGSSYCTAPTDPDYYGKFSYHWSSNGTTTDKQLKPWLDPINANPSTKTGVNYNACSGAGVPDVTIPNLNINIYPNPASDHISVSFENYDFESGNMMIVDALGKVVDSYQIDMFTGEIIVPVQNYSDGIYYIHITNNDHSFSGSFMILQ
jgi:hypothetical protein